MAREISPAQLARMAERMRDMGEVVTERVTIAELLPDAFIQKHTEYASRADFFADARRASGADADADMGEFLNSEEFGQFVARNTPFPDWRDMVAQAQKERLIGKLLD